MRNKYHRTHPLWAVYNLQKQILKSGGKIDRNSDLLSHFEKKSLSPEIGLKDVLLNLANGNDVYNIEDHKYKDIKDLIKSEFLYYREVYINFYFNTTQRIKYSEKPDSGYSLNIPDYLKNEKELSSEGYLLGDNEFVLRRNGISRVIILNPKYTNILRLIINGYNPQEKEMKKNKNLLPAIILALGLIISTIIFACSTRYELIDSGVLIFDRWTGSIGEAGIK